MVKTQVIDFKFGSLIRTGPSLKYGGKWDAQLEDEVRNGTTNATLTIHITIYFNKIDPADGAATGTHGDHDDSPTHPSKKKIQKWADGEFETYTNRLVSEAQSFWNGKFWLKTPDYYRGLNWPERRPRYRCNIFCRFELEQVYSEKDAHYTIAVVRTQDGEQFRSDAALYTQEDIDAKQMISKSTYKFWTHYHEVGHLIGLGHVGYGKKHNLHNDGSPKAYGVTTKEMHDVMGRGHVRHNWHARPWQEAAEEFTGVKWKRWEVSQWRLYPEPL